MADEEIQTRKTMSHEKKPLHSTELFIEKSEDSKSPMDSDGEKLSL